MNGQSALDALWAALDQAVPRPPQGAITSYEYAAKYGVHRRQAEERLKEQLRSGTLESGIFTADGHPKRYYWLAKKGKK